MEIENYKKSQIVNDEKHKNGDIYYLLHGPNTWESRNKLSSLNSLVVKNYLRSNSKKVKQSEEREKHMHQKFVIDDRERILSADNIKQEDFVHTNDGRCQANRFCNIVDSLLQDDREDETKRSVCSDDSLKLAHSDNINFSRHVVVKKLSSNSYQLTHAGDKHLHAMFVKRGLQTVLL